MSTEPAGAAAPETEEPIEVAVVATPALELISRAEIDMQIATAKKYPRGDLFAIRQRMLSYATLDEETAEGCFYTLKRYDKETKETKLIQGPSVRLAEIAMVCYKNIRAGSRVIDNDGKKVTSQGVCFDLENNVMISAESARRITTKDGRTYNEDMQIVTANACNSIARRNAIFQVIPLALIKPVYEEARKVATGGASTLEVKREKVFKRFYSMGVEKDRILAVLKRESMESVDLDDLAILIGLGTSIKDGELTIEQAFLPLDQGDEAGTETEPRSKLKQRILERRAAKAKEAKS